MLYKNMGWSKSANARGRLTLNENKNNGGSGRAVLGQNYTLEMIRVGPLSLYELFAF